MHQSDNEGGEREREREMGGREEPSSLLPPLLLQLLLLPRPPRTIQ